VENEPSIEEVADGGLGVSPLHLDSLIQAEDVAQRAEEGELVSGVTRRGTPRTFEVQVVDGVRRVARALGAARRRARAGGSASESMFVDPRSDFEREQDAQEERFWARLEEERPDRMLAELPACMRVYAAIHLRKADTQDVVASTIEGFADRVEDLVKALRAVIKAGDHWPSVYAAQLHAGAVLGDPDPLLRDGVERTDEDSGTCREQFEAMKRNGTLPADLDLSDVRFRDEGATDGD
jgi:hypothetical protein